MAGSMSVGEAARGSCSTIERGSKQRQVREKAKCKQTRAGKKKKKDQEINREYAR